MDRKSGMSRRVILIIIYVFFLAIFCEAASRAFLFVSPVFHRIKGFDNSSQRIGWVRRHSNQREFFYNFDVYHPIRGWTLQPNVKDMNVFNGKILNSNSRGIRGKNEYEYQRQIGKERILVFGDSYTFGDEVSDDETYSHYLEELLPGTEVLNMGIHGYGHDQMLLYLKEEGFKYNPDIVVVGYVWFDIYRSLFKFNNYCKPKFDLRGHTLHLTSVPVPQPKLFFDHEVYRSKGIDLGVIFFEKLRWMFGINQKRSVEITKAIFDEVVAINQKIGAQTIFVYLPVLEELSNMDKSMTKSEQFLFTYCKERRIPCLLLRQRFLEEKSKGAVFNVRSHWFSKEHRIAAQGIMEFLLGNGMVKIN